MIINSSNNTRLFGYNDFFLYLKNLYDKNILPNKIIFSGEAGIGKSTLTYHLTNYIFSKNEENKYDFKNNNIIEKNYSYNLIVKNSHPNFFLISNDENKSSIQISKIREMINFTNKSSFNNSCKIIFIDNAEYLNINSNNALLKIIEEPNDKVFFFLINNNKKKILDTLKSRCIQFNLYLNNKDKMEIFEKILNKKFYSLIHDDFKNFYNSPGNILLLSNIFTNNNIDISISIENFLKLVIVKSLYKKDSQIKDNLPFFIELYFKKKIHFEVRKDKIYNLYKHFLRKLYDCNKFNLDTESVLIEFDGNVLNG